MQFRNGTNCFCHQMIHIFYHRITFFKFCLRKISCVTLFAGADHFITIALPFFLCKPCDVCRFHHVEPGCRFAIGIKHTEP